MLAAAMSFDDTGRRSVTARMQMKFGDVVVLKCKACTTTSMNDMVGYVFDPDNLHLILNDVLYPDWGGGFNNLRDPAQLIHVEGNRASSYLVFKPV